MSEYLRDSGHNDMRTCVKCGGAFYAGHGPSREEEAWTCDTCKAHAAEIERLQADLSRLTPAGQVVEDEALLARFIDEEKGVTWVVAERLEEALSRLAAKA